MATKSQLPWKREAVILSVALLLSLQTPSIIISASVIGQKTSGETNRPDHGDSMALQQSLWDKILSGKKSSGNDVEESRNVASVVPSKVTQDTEAADVGVGVAVGNNSIPENKDFCDRDGVDGCSVPYFKKHMPFVPQFTPSCYRHDQCYRCGILYDVNRLQCDNGFKDNMMQTCYANANLSEEDKRIMESLMRDKATTLNAIMMEAIHDMTNGSGDLVGIVLGSDLEEALRKKIVVEWLVFLGQFLKHDDEHVVEIESSHQEVSQECVQLLEAADEISLSAHGYRVSHVVNSGTVMFYICKAAAYLFYEAVRHCADKYYHHFKAEPHCTKKYVRKCLPLK